MIQELGFVFVDIQFDTAAETLCIVLDNEAYRRLPCLSHRNHENEATIDARLLWNLLIDLIDMGVMNPTIQLRKGDRDHSQAPHHRGAQ